MRLDAAAGRGASTASTGPRPGSGAGVDSSRGKATSHVDAPKDPSPPKPSPKPSGQASAGVENLKTAGTADSHERRAKATAAAAAADTPPPKRATGKSKGEPNPEKDERPRTKNTSGASAAGAAGTAGAGAGSAESSTSAAPDDEPAAPAADDTPPRTDSPPRRRAQVGQPHPAAHRTQHASEERDDRPSRSKKSGKQRDKAGVPIVSAVAGASGGPAASVRNDGGVRVVTINIHKLVPASNDRTDKAERKAALRDTAEWLNGLDPDVIVFQELDDDRARAGKDGVNEQLRRLAKLIGADGASMAAAYSNGAGDLYDNAIMTRNGFTLEHNYAADLPNPNYEVDRALGVADVRTPDGQDLTVLYSHTTARKFSIPDLHLQIDAIGAATREVRATGELRYRDALTGASHVATGLSRDNVVLAGDFNAPASRVYDAVGSDAMLDVVDAPGILADEERARAAREASHGTRRIDHVFVAPGMQVTNAFVQDVAANRVQGDDVTDHRGVIADVQLAPASAPIAATP